LIIQSDLTRDVGWGALYDAGWRGVASVAINETWSGVRFRPGTIQPEEGAFETQYAGAKAALRPIYDRVLVAIQGFGDDIELQTRQTYVAFARGKQFAIRGPSFISSRSRPVHAEFTGGIRTAPPLARILLSVCGLAPAG
jgi:hypothetical protein